METVQRITEIEKRAKEIIDSAERERKHALAGARKKAEALLEERRQSARREGQALIEQARKEAEKEKENIEQGNSAEIEALRKKTAPKMAEAKKLCR